MNGSNENDNPPVPPSIPAAAKTGPDGAYWDYRRLEIRGWLLLNAPSLAEMYESVIQLRFGSDLPVRARFIAHGIREIANNLPSCLRVEIKGRVEYQQLVNGFAQEWRDAGLPVGEQPAPVPVTGVLTTLDKIAVPIRIVHTIGGIVEQHDKSRSRVKSNAEALFLAFYKQTGASAESLRPIINKWVDLCYRFVGRSKLDDRSNNPRRDGDIFDDEDFIKNFQLFEDLLYTLVAKAKFFDVIGEIDAIQD